MSKPRFITSAIWPDKHKDILKEMHAAGATALEIAIKLGRTRNSVIGFIHRAGLARPKPVKQPAQPKQPKPKAKPKPLFIKPIIEIDIPKQTTLFVFTSKRQCKYIEGEANGIDTRVCGNRTIEGTSWCFEHHALVYTKPPVLNMRGQLHG